MKFLFINVASGVRSTGRICTDIGTALEADGHTYRVGYGRFGVPEKFRENSVRIGSTPGVLMHYARARLFDDMGLGSRRATEKFIKWAREYDPDVIHIHNVHGYYINIEVLFDYLRTCGKPVVWTLHDCWAFTGHCVHFDYSGCEKWLSGCEGCEQRGVYPARILCDRSRRNFALKKRLFTSVPDMTLVTPSEWLADLARRSFLSEYPIKVINNGVDTAVFHPTESDILARLGVEGKKIVLGVAAVWDSRKGLDCLLKLADRLDDNYHVILVGVSRKQSVDLPANVTPIEFTSSVRELAELYSAADVFVNPTFEDNYPTTNIEAIACGTPVVTFNTGGSVESARMFGTVVEKGDIDGLLNAVKNAGTFRRTAGADDVDVKRTVREYKELYYGMTE